MNVILTESLRERLPDYAYWEEDGKYYSNIEHLEYVRELGLSEIISEDLINEVRALVVVPITYKIYDLLYEVPDLETRMKFPGSIVFPEQLSVNLHKVNKKSYGALVLSTYYKSYDPVTNLSSEPIVKIEYTYTRDSQYLLTSKLRIISWMLSNGTWSPQTQVDTLYCTTESEKLIEIKALRSSVVDEAEALAKETGLWPYVKPLFERYVKEITLYKEAGSKQFSNILRDDVENSAWLDMMTRDKTMTIRNFLVNFFKIGSPNA